jgi:hypothetical protein
VLDAVLAKDKLRGRSPDGTGQWRHPDQPTPGSSNSFALRKEIVINEIMYAPISGDSNDEYVELYNRGTNTVDLSGWKFTAGIDFAIPTGTSLAAGAYLVVGKNAGQLISNYPNLTTQNTMGDFHGTLANGGERLCARSERHHGIRFAGSAEHSAATGADCDPAGLFVSLLPLGQP